MAFNLEDLKDRNPVADVAARYTTLHRVGRRLGGPCPICGGDPRKGRFEVMENETWTCAVCNKGGDVIRLVELVEGVDFKTAVARLGGAAELDPAQAAKLAEKRDRARLARETAEERRRETDRKILHGIWKQVAKIEGTVAQRYLKARGLQLPPSTGLRFVGAMPYHNGGARKLYSGPAMVAAFKRRDGKFGGLHQTWLKPDGAGKAEIVDAENGQLLPAKKMRGQKAGCHIAVAAFGKPRRLFIAEGIETVLSVYTAMKLEGRPLDDVAFWAAGDLGNLAGRAADTIDHPTLKRPDGKPQRVPNRVPDPQDQGLAIPDSVDELVLLGDGDSDPFLTECAMTRAARRYAREGRRVFVAMAPRAEDFNDELRASGAAAVMQIIERATMADKKADNVASIDDARKAKKKEPKEPKAAPAPASDDDEKLLEEMNEKWAVTRIGGKTRVMVLEPHEIYLECLVPEFMTLADHKAFFHRRQYRRMPSGQMRWVGEAEWWQMQNDRQQYSKVIFYPEHNVPGAFNLWRGFGVKPSDTASCDRYIEHLHEVICDGDENNAEYLMNWMAWKLQNPHVPPGVAVVLRGVQGAGKGEFVHGYGRLFGPYYRHVTNAKHLVGNFNAHLLATALLFADEAFFAADRSHDGILKALITEPHLSIEKKGYDLLDAARNCLGVFMASNSNWVIPADHDARRYFVLIVSDRRKGDASYFAKIRHEMANGGAAALMHRLLQRDLTGFDIRDRPLTEALRQQQRYSIRGTDALIKHLCGEGILLDVHDRYAHIAVTTGESERKGFYASARRVVPDLGRMLSQTIAEELCREWGCKMWKSNSARGIEFLALSDLRQRFEAKYGPQDWSTSGSWSLAGETKAMPSKGESEEDF